MYPHFTICVSSFYCVRTYCNRYALTHVCVLWRGRCMCVERELLMHVCQVLVWGKVGCFLIREGNLWCNLCVLYIYVCVVHR